jgi:multiple sugar transport system ATP-binding protein
MTMGHRVAVLKDGLLQQCDTPRVLYDHPDNVFVAGFIGSPAMNLMTVPLADGGAKVGTLLVPLTRAVTEDAGRANLTQVTLGVRPEAFELARDTNGFPLRVELVEELGADAYVYGASPATSPTGDQKQLVVRVNAGQEPEIGQTIELTIRPDQTHVFNPETGLRLGG